MFKCKECGTEYDIKPDFCDCGNDVFEEISGTAKSNNKTQSLSDENNVINSKKTFNEQYPEFERLKQIFDPISTIVFLLCLISGLAVLFFVGNTNKDNIKTTETNKENVEQTINIPSIDSIWNNSTSGIINNEKILAQTKKIPQTAAVKTNEQQITNPMLAKIENTLNSPNKVEAPVKQNTKKNQQQLPVTQTKNTQKQQPAPQSKPVNVQTSTTQKSTSISNTNIQKPNIPKNTQAAANQPKNQTQTSTTKQTNTAQSQPATKVSTNQNINSSTTTPKTNTTKTKNTQIPVQNTLRPKATVDTQALQKELNKYKIGLRDTIGRKIDFASVIGDGECIVSFKIASNGKLTNRAFAKQSSNITLNDAVYSAIMATPSYNPPPTGYNNETMNLKIRFYSGNFDVSLN